MQLQTVFPATGYIAIAVKASKIVALDLQRSLQLVQVQHLVVEHAVSINENGAGILCLLDKVKSNAESLSGTFSVFVVEGDSLKKCVFGQVTVFWGEEDASILPSRSTDAGAGLRTGLTIGVDEFYQYLAQL